MNNQFLTQIIEQKKTEIKLLYDTFGLSYYEQKVSEISVKPHRFYRALFQPGFHLIAEVKKASPSKGIIRHDFNPVKIAKEFQAKGATVLSVLTDQTFFHGHPNYVSEIAQEVSLPILRKDFIIDPIQIYQAKVIGAQAILLICACLTPEQLETLYETAIKLDLDVLFEVHNEDEINALSALENVKLVGVNNRNLHTFEVYNTLAIDLAPIIREKISAQCLIIAESGYSQAKELQLLENAGINAVLIGEGLATSPDLLQFFERAEL